jgi:hypothetical protein
VEILIKSPRVSRRVTAVAAWATQVRTVANEVVKSAWHVTLVEVGKELQLLSKQG